ncbi:MAG: polymer-forming cytoskeletal protein [Desulfobacterales bacterium]|nr:polymer-forming cytoskeletal protein [Desulfobacterales bacterium]
MKKAKHTDATATYIGADAVIRGEIQFVGTIRIDGKVEGKIISDAGVAIVAENALVKADINVSVAIVSGQVHGNIYANRRIEIYPPGRVDGNVMAPVISVEAGSVINGTCAITARTISFEKEGGAPDAALTV